MEVIDALSDEARMQVRLRAKSELYLRATAVIQQTKRLRDRDQPAAEYMADMWLLSHAIRGTLKFGEFCLDLSEEYEARHLRVAIDKFKRHVPDAVQLRNVLEHFDDYLLGIGRNKRAVTEPTFFYERGDRIRIHVADMMIDVEAAEEASINLATSAIAGDTEESSGDIDYNQT
jgi:hypothetical protein